MPGTSLDGSSKQVEDEGEIMNRNGSSYRWMGLAAACLLAVALVGCSGSDSNDSGAAAPPPATGGGTAPAGDAVAKAAAANPAATNTAANPNQAFGLIAGVGTAPVLVQSPPVVYFTVIDSAGKFVPGLKLVTDSAAATAADPNCSANNVTFAISKLAEPTGSSPSTWQSLISRQRLDANATTPVVRYAVVEGTTDPKPTSYTVSGTSARTNPPTAVADPATRIVGILEENAAGAYYTYRFAMDVTTPMLVKDAPIGKSVANTPATATNPAYQNRVANNGNVAVKDGKTIHRIGAQLCYTDAATKKKVVVNSLMDFTLDATGVAVPVKASDGKTGEYKKVVDKASCNECHAALTAHGTRVDPNYCVICHNPGSADYYTTNPIDLKLMIHKFHMGKGTLTGAKLINDYRVTAARVGNAKTTNATTGEVTGFVYPQAPQNCVKCHDGSATAAHKTAQGDNWKNVPSRNACGACHDGIDFTTGKGQAIGSTYPGHIGGAQANDNNCVLCHSAASIPVYHKDTTPTTADASKRTMSATISKVVIGATDGSVTVTFSVTDNGLAVTDKTKFTAPAFGIAKLVPAAKGESTHWVSYTSRFRTKSGTMAPVLQGNKEGNGTLTANADGTFSYRFKLITADPEGDIRKVTHAHNVSTASATMTNPAYVGTAWTGPGATIPGTGVNVVAYEPNLTHRVAMLFQKVGTPNVDSTANAYFDFVPAGGAVTSTRNIVTMNNCSTCHAGVKLHEGYTTEYCVICHNQSTLDPFTAEPVDFQRLIHKLHMGINLPSVVAGGKYVVNGTHDYSKGAYPGNIKDCAVCHKETATKPGTTTPLENAANWYTTPTSRACGTCHDSTAALGHINSQVTASGEQCAFCHGPTGTYGLDVKSVHGK